MGISIGLVGLGSFGSAFADLFRAHPAVSRVGLCDREPERIARFANRPDWIASGKLSASDCYDSLGAICRSDLDALVLITQPWLHAPQAIAAMESGKHVYSAVPVITLPDPNEVLEWCDKLVNACRRTGMRYMLGETTCYRPEAMYCLRRAREGGFGTFTYAEGEYFHDFAEPSCDLRQVRRDRANSAAGREWELRKQEYFRRGIGFGPMGYPTHSVSGPMWAMNAHAVKVSCFGQAPITSDPFFANDGMRFGNQTALYRMSNGSVMRVCEHRECSVGRETFRLYGTAGSFEWGQFKSHAGATKLTDEQMRDPLPEAVVQAWTGIDGTSAFYGGHGGSHAYLVNEFVDAISSGRQPAVHAWSAVRFMAAGVAAHQSSERDGELLPVTDWGDAPA